MPRLHVPCSVLVRTDLNLFKMCIYNLLAWDGAKIVYFNSFMAKFRFICYVRGSIEVFNNSKQLLKCSNLDTERMKTILSSAHEFKEIAYMLKTIRLTLLTTRHFTPLVYWFEISVG